MELEFKAIDPVTIVPKYGCPFCILYTCLTRSELETHIVTCNMYHALDDNLPTSPNSAIVIDPDYNYTLDKYLADEELYFEIMISVSAEITTPPPTLPGALAYFDREISTHANPPLNDLRKKNLSWRLLSTFYKLPNSLLQSMMSEIYNLNIGDGDSDSDNI